MGIDTLDITFRLEKRFGLVCPKRLWSSFGHLYDGRPDVTAGELAAAVTALLGGAATVVPAAMPERRPGALEYQSRVGGPWPTPPPFDADVWVGVCQVLADALGVSASEVVPQSRLVRDLGMG